MTKQGRCKQSGEQSKKHVHVSENGHTGNKSGCPISKKCGGCQYIDKSYAEQLKIKTDQVKKLLAPYGSVDEIIGMKEPYHYRNKVNVARFWRVCMKRERTVYCRWTIVRSRIVGHRRL